MNVNYDDIGDILEYGNISDNEAIDLCNRILEESINEKDNVILESMFNAVYIGVSHHNIAKNIDIDAILPKLEFFNEEILDYIITIMAFSGDLRYIELIEKIGEIYPELDVDEAILELKSNR